MNLWQEFRQPNSIAEAIEDLTSAKKKNNKKQNKIKNKKIRKNKLIEK